MDETQLNDLKFVTPNSTWWMHVALLSEMTAGKRGIIINVAADGKLEKRLRELGFVSGSTIHVLNNKHGYIMVRVRGVKYGLSPEITRMIYVKENEPSPS